MNRTTSIERVPSESIELRMRGETIASVIIIYYTDTIFLDSLVVTRGNRLLGYGTQLMDWLVHNLGKKQSLSLVPEGFDDSPLSDEQLVSWYEKYGFVLGGDYMTRLSA